MWSRESSSNKRLHYTPLVPLIVLLLVRSTLSYMQIKFLFASNVNAHSASNYRTLSLLRPNTTESFSVLFLQAKLGECFALWFALTPPSLKWLTEQKNPFEVCKLAARYNEFGYKSSYQKKDTCQSFPAQKNPETENFKPQKILRSSRSLEIWSTPLPSELKLQKVLKSISYY